MKKRLTCIECPVGCEMDITMEGDKVADVRGNSCPRGRLYAEAEMVSPKRVVTSTVRAENGDMIPVKTDRPVRKEAIFEVMQKINEITCKLPVWVGQVLVEGICDDANLIATGNFLDARNSK